MLFYNNFKIAIFFTFFSFPSLHFTGEHVQGLGMLLSYHVSQHTSSDCRAQTFPNGQRLLGGGTLTACPGHSPLLCDSPLPRASSLKGTVPLVLMRCSSFPVSRKPPFFFFLHPSFIWGNKGPIYPTPVSNKKVSLFSTSKWKKKKRSKNLCMSWNVLL